MLDTAHLESLREHLPEAALNGLMQALAQDLAEKSQQLAAVAISDAEMVMRLAHDLKSASGNAGALTLSHAARDLEQAARAGNIPLEPLRTKVMTLVVGTQEALAKF